MFIEIKALIDLINCKMHPSMHFKDCHCIYFSISKIFLNEDSSHSALWTKFAFNTVCTMKVKLWCETFCLCQSEDFNYALPCIESEKKMNHFTPLPGVFGAPAKVVNMQSCLCITAWTGMTPVAPLCPSYSLLPFAIVMGKLVHCLPLCLLPLLPQSQHSQPSLWYTGRAEVDGGEEEQCLQSGRISTKINNVFLCPGAAWQRLQRTCRKQSHLPSDRIWKLSLLSQINRKHNLHYTMLRYMCRILIHFYI